MDDMVHYAETPPEFPDLSFKTRQSLVLENTCGCQLIEISELDKQDQSNFQTIFQHICNIGTISKGSASLVVFVSWAIGSASAQQTYSEDFTTTTYKDEVNTTADWNTSDGELKLGPFVPTHAGFYNTPGNCSENELRLFRKCSRMVSTFGQKKGTMRLKFLSVASLPSVFSRCPILFLTGSLKMLFNQPAPNSFRALCLAVFLLTATVSSSQIQHDLGELSARQWTSKHGLPSNVIRDISQDKDGFLWIATFSGLARFDGLNFQNYDLTNAPELGTTQISQVEIDDQGRVWIVQMAGGLAFFQNESFTRFPLPEGQKAIYLLNTAAGKLLVGTSEGLVQIDNGQIESFTPMGVVWDLRQDKFNRAWVLHRPNDSQSSFEFVCLEAGLVRQRIPIPFTPDFITFGTDQGLIATHDDSLSFVSIEGIGTESLEQVFVPEFLTISKTAKARVEHVVIHNESNGPVWVGGPNGLFRLDSIFRSNNEHHQTSFEMILPGTMTNHIRVFFEGRNGVLWVGTETGGLFCLENSISQPADFPTGWQTNFSQVEKVPHVPWLGSRVEGSSEVKFLLWNLPGTEVFPLQEKQTMRGYFSPEQAADGVFVHSSRGEQYFSKGVFHDPDFPQQISLCWWRARGIGDEIWYHKDGHLLRLSNTVTDTIASCDRVFQRTDKGEIWYRSKDQIYRYYQGEIDSYAHYPELPITKVRDSWVDPDGRIWLGYHGSGLACLHDGKYRLANTGNGLPDNTVGGLLADGQGRLWANSNQGIFVMEEQAMRQFANHETDKLHSRLVTNVEAGNYWAAKGQDDRLYFNSIEGIVAIDPDDLPPAQGPPSAKILWIKYSGKKIPHSANSTLPLGERNFSIGFTAPIMQNAPQIQFRYKMGDIAPHWQNAEYMREVFFPHLPPGSHKFEVNASNESGQWSPLVDTITIVIPARFYETFWFKFIVFGSFLVSVYFLFLWRTSMKLAHLTEIENESERRLNAEVSLRKMGRQLINAQEGERKRIARELHDDVNQRLAVLAMELDMLESGRSRPPADLARNVQELAGDIHRISHSLHPSRIGQLGLAKALAALCHEINIVPTCEIKFRADDSLGDISELVSLSLYRVAQESIHNAVKYSKSSMIQVSLNLRDHGLMLIVSDDGIGFNQQDSNIVGLGLISMSERIGSIGGILDIFSELGKGTTITAYIPAKEKAIE